MISCTFEDGGKTSLRHITVNAMILNSENQILLCKRGTRLGKPLLEFGKYALIGGYLDRDETLSQGLQREIREETGSTVSNVQLFRIVDTPQRPKEDRQNVEFVFTCTIESEPEHHQDEEVLELRWFDLDAIPEPEDWAFDHFESVMLFKKQKNDNLAVPILG